jgi:hypothetical protein
MCQAQPSTSTATMAAGNATSIVHGPNGLPSSHPVIPAVRRIDSSRRSAAESARSAAAASSRAERAAPWEPMFRQNARYTESNRTYLCSARSRNTEPSGTAAAVSSAVRGRPVDGMPPALTRSTAARSRRRTRIPGRLRNPSLRGTVTSISAGAFDSIPCHQAAAGPEIVARSRPTARPTVRGPGRSARAPCEVDPRGEPFPALVPDPAPQRALGKAVPDGLDGGDQPVLAGEEREKGGVRGHGERIARRRSRSWPFGRTRRHDRRLGAFPGHIRPEMRPTGDQDWVRPTGARRSAPRCRRAPVSRARPVPGRCPGRCRLRSRPPVATRSPTAP